MHVVLVAGTRPNFVKVAPILKELDSRRIRSVLVHTGQHYDVSMSHVFFEELAIRSPDVNLGVGSGTHAHQTAAVMTAFEPVLLADRPDWVIVVGDVNSTLACALVAAKENIRVAHVEAGLRSGDWSMPEEINRVVIDRLSSLLLTPSEDADSNLIREGCASSSIVRVGNVMIDTLLDNLERARQRSILSALGLKRGGFVLLTLHRPSNVDDPVVFEALLRAVGRVAEQIPVVFPVHPRLEELLIHGQDLPPGLTLLEPVGYLDSIALQDAAALVLTDSGGIQEETTVLGTPCLTLRNSTERPVTVTEGTNVLAGTDPERIVSLAEQTLINPPAPRKPALWDGRASIRVVDAVMKGPEAR